MIEKRNKNYYQYPKDRTHTKKTFGIIITGWNHLLVMMMKIAKEMKKKINKTKLISNT